MSDQADTIQQLSFEAALKRLEEIVRKLESGEASLDDSIELYAEGDRLKQQCEARLRAAQVVIVHARQVVVDERVDVDTFRRKAHP
jgi:exodeoxyribonuclease VII small subunit